MRNIRDSNSVYKSMHFEAKDNLKHSTLYTQKWKKKAGNEELEGEFETVYTCDNVC